MIYEPKGKAREYSPLALNVFNGCDHGCAYCYAPAIKFTPRETYYSEVEPRKNYLIELQKELKKNAPKNQVLLSFIGDPYSKANDKFKLTRKTLELFLFDRVPAAILTKGGSRCLQDIDIFKKFGDHIKVGATLTFDNEADSREWEAGAALPEDRIKTLKELHKNGIKTWASFEPVIKPDQALNLIYQTIPFVDEYRIGKINNFRQLDKYINWTEFLKDALLILRGANKQIYIKQDLRENAPSIKLSKGETNMDANLAEPWNEIKQDELF